MKSAGDDLDRTRPSPIVLGDSKGVGKSVVIVHGSLDHGSAYARVASFIPDYSVVSYDRRGWGQSRPLGGEGVNFLTHVDDLSLILRDLDTPILLGHSYGALVAFGAAARLPSSVAGIVAIEPPVRWLPWWPSDDPWEEPVRRAAVENDPEKAARVMLSQVLGTRSLIHLARANRSDLEHDGVSLIREMLDSSTALQFFEPTTFPIPTVVAAGSQSAEHHCDVARGLAAILPFGHFHEIARAGHASHITHPQEVAKLVSKIQPVEELFQ